MKKIILLGIFTILIIQLVSAGVTTPLPSNMELLKGEDGRFKFEIQGVNQESNLICDYSFESEPLFEVEFDEDSVVVEAGEILEVYGTVKVPKDLDYGSYTAEFCVICNKESTEAGASVNINTCGLPLNVNVVDERTRENLYVPDKVKNYKLVLLIVVIVSIIILALVITALLKKKTTKRKYKKKR